MLSLEMVVGGELFRVLDFEFRERCPPPTTDHRPPTTVLVDARSRARVIACGYAVGASVLPKCQIADDAMASRFETKAPIRLILRQKARLRKSFKLNVHPQDFKSFHQNA